MVTVTPNLYQFTLKLQRNATKCDGRTDRQTTIGQLSYNNIDSNDPFSFGIGEQFLSITDNITRQPASVTAKGKLNVILAY